MTIARLMQMARAGVPTGGGVVWTDPDLANASYDSVSFSVGGQAASPIDFYIKPDGTRFFVADLATDSIYQYSMSSAWDMSSASYDSISFSVASQATDPRGVAFKPDGTRMFILDANTDDIYQYSLSTAWDVSTASYDSVNLALSALITIGSGIFFNPDGTKFFIPCRGSDYIYEYDLSSAYDISTASYNSVRINVVSVDNTPEGVYFSPTGDKMFFAGAGNDAVYQYSLSSNFDLSSATYDSLSFSVATQDTVPSGLSFKSDGSKMYILGLGTDTIYQYSTA
jgi:DNA-binding beta-propeller fold protein YncE